MKIIPIRTALNNRKKYKKSDLYRFYKNDDKIVFDYNHSYSGRGYYFSKDFDLTTKQDLKKYLSSIFKMKISEEDINTFKKAYLKEREDKQNG